AVQKAEVQPGVGKSHAPKRGGRRAADQLHARMVLERRKVDAEFERVIQLHAENHRLDGDLPRLAIDLGKNLVELEQDRFIITNDDRVDTGEAVATRFGLVGRNIDL